MKRAWLKLISVLVPYVAVVVGLYILKNAWVAIGLYHFGIAVFLMAGNKKSLLKKVCAGWNYPMAAAGVLARLSRMCRQIFFMDGFRVCRISHSCFSMVYKVTLAGNSVYRINCGCIHLETISIEVRRPGSSAVISYSS